MMSGQVGEVGWETRKYTTEIYSCLICQLTSELLFTILVTAVVFLIPEQLEHEFLERSGIVRR
jgi:hypothetical protein